MDGIDISDEMNEKYEAILLSEDVERDMKNTIYNCNPSDFTRKDLNSVDNIISMYVIDKCKARFKGLNCKFIVECLRKSVNGRSVYFPTTDMIKRHVKVRILFEDQSTLNKLKLINPELYDRIKRKE